MSGGMGDLSPWNVFSANSNSQNSTIQLHAAIVKEGDALTGFWVKNEETGETWNARGLGGIGSELEDLYFTGARYMARLSWKKSAGSTDYTLSFKCFSVVMVLTKPPPAPAFLPASVGRLACLNTTLGGHYLAWSPVSLDSHLAVLDASQHIITLGPILSGWEYELVFESADGVVAFCVNGAFVNPVSSALNALRYVITVKKDQTSPFVLAYVLRGVVRAGDPLTIQRLRAV